MSLPPPPRRARIKAPKKVSLYLSSHVGVCTDAVVIDQRAEPAQDTLVLLSRAIKQIQLHNASQLSFEEQYRYAYDLVMHKEGHTLYNRVAELIAEHLEKEARELVVPVFPPSSSLASVAGYGTDSMVSAAAGQLFLTKLREVWNDHIACMSKLRDVLRYMVRCCFLPSDFCSWQLLTVLPFTRTSATQARMPIRVHGTWVSPSFYTMLYSTRPILRLHPHALPPIVLPPLTCLRPLWCYRRPTPVRWPIT